MKRTAILLSIVFMYKMGQAQLAIDYFGQKPPEGSPEKFAPGLISKENRYQLMAAFSPDGKEFCFTVTNEHWSHFEIWDTKYNAGKWTEPKVMPFLTSAGGFGPVFSAGKRKLFFTSGNWVTHPSTIWYSLRNKDGWNAAVKLDTPVNSAADQWQFSMADDGTLVFASDRPGGKGGYDIYIAEPVDHQYPIVTNIGALNSPADEYSAFIAPDKSYIIFSSQRAGGYGWDDLYISFRQRNKNWTKPINLGSRINTIHAEFSPQVSPDGKYLLYSKWDKHNKWSDIYWVRIDNLIIRLKRQCGII
jgi:Tol biopolymer transport system component